MNTSSNIFFQFLQSLLLLCVALVLEKTNGAQALAVMNVSKTNTNMETPKQDRTIRNADYGELMETSLEETQKLEHEEYVQMMEHPIVKRFSIGNHTGHRPRMEHPIVKRFIGNHTAQVRRMEHPVVKRFTNGNTAPGRIIPGTN